MPGSQGVASAPRQARWPTPVSDQPPVIVPSCAPTDAVQGRTGPIGVTPDLQRGGEERGGEGGRDAGRPHRSAPATMCRRAASGAGAAGQDSQNRSLHYPPPHRLLRRLTSPPPPPPHHASCAPSAGWVTNERASGHCSRCIQLNQP